MSEAKRHVDGIRNAEVRYSYYECNECKKLIPRDERTEHWRDYHEEPIDEENS
jgi:hypothetical protein